MMMSLTRRFIFIANLKSASTSIEKMLRPFSEIAVDEARYGKHASLSLIEQRFPWIFSETKLGDFFVFGVIRDPVTFLLSLFNSHSDEKFSNEASLYTGNLDIGACLTRWIAQNYDQAQPQYRRFLDSQDNLAINLIIDFDRLKEGLELAAEALELPLEEMPKENPSQVRFERTDLTSQQTEWIRREYAADYYLLERQSNKRHLDGLHGLTSSIKMLRGGVAG